MSKRQMCVVIFLVLVFALGLVSTANAADLNQCMNCHFYKAQPTADVTKFILQKVFDGSMSGSTVDKTVCKTCHWIDIGSQHFPTYQTVTVTVYGATYGGFKSTDSIYSIPGTLHDLHNGPKRAVGGTCTRCHGVVSCSTCHNTVPHEGHYTGTGINPKTGASIITPTLTVATGGKNIQQSSTCAASECHQTLPSPKRYNTDGTDLCLNCHNTDRAAGHTELRLQVPHNTTFSGSLTFKTLLTGSYVVDCNGCHNNILSTEHANRNRTCDTCHKSANTAVVDVIRTAKGVEANRACEKCHFNPAVLPQPPLGTAREEHKVFHIATQSDNLKVDGAPHADCNICHQRTSPITMQITEGTTVTSTTLAQLAGSTAKNYSCLSCHNGAPNPKAPLHEANYNGQQMKVLDIHSNCSTCHAPGTTYAAKVDSIATALSTNPAAGYSCTECHTNLANGGHKAKFEGVPYADTTSFHLNCTSCHNPTYKATVASLKDVVKLGGSYDCSACHLASNTMGTTPYYPKHQAGNDGIVGFHPQSCNTCHGVVNGAYRISLNGIRSKLPTPGYACADCHNGITAPQANHSAKMSATGNVYNTTSLHPSCGTCHNNVTVQPTITSLKGQSGYLCDSCHTGTMQPKHSAAITVTGTVYGAVYDTVGFHPDCSTCHSNQNVFSVIGTLKAKNPYTCWDCHNDQVAKNPQHQAKFKPTDTQPSAVVGFHPAGCSTCHNPTVSPKVALAGASTTGYECSVCHDGGVAGQPSHSAQLDATSTPSDTTNIHPTCNTCHGNTTSRIANLQTAITDLKAQVKLGQVTYQCSACHGDVSARHLSTTDLASPMNIVNCSWCHSNQIMDTHLKPVVTLSKTLSCETCHGSTAPAGVKNAIALGQKDCISCHTGAANAAPAPHPDSQYRPKHSGVFPQFTGITGYPSPNCVNCHNEAGAVPYIDTFHMTPGQVGGKILGCKTCHDNTTNPAYKAAVVAQSTNCAGCHQANMENKHVAFHVVDNTTSANTAQCLSCHALPGATTSTLTDVHKKRPASTVTCDTCHDANARAAVKAAVAANNKACEACHTGGGHLHNVTAYETDANLSKVSCANCHATDTAAKSTELSKLHADRGFGCATCHNDKFEVQNPIIVKDGTFNIPVCSTCHNGTLAPNMGKYPQHTGTDTSHSSATGIGNYTYGGNVNCSSCHTALANGSFALSPVHTKVTCDACHSSTVTQVNSVISGNWSRTVTKTPYACADCHNSLPNKHLPEHKAVSTEQVDCTNCHIFNATQVVDTPGIHVTKGCDSCHGATAPQVVTDFVTPKVGQVNPVYNCENCHDQIPGGHNKNHVVNAYLTNNATTECASCHNTDVSVLHTGNIGGKTLSCNSCHGAVLSQTAPQATKTVIANNLSSNPNRTGFNCDSCHTNINGGHKHPVASFEINPRVDCALCHTTDTVTKTTDLAQLHAARNVGCSSCHNAKFEGTIIVKDGVVNVPACSTCHNGTLATDAGVKYPEHSGTDTSHMSATAFGTYNDPKSQGSDCATCHTSLAVSVVHTKLTCNTCHTSTVTQVKQVIDGNMSRVTAKPGFACVDCHNSLPVKHAPEHQAVNNIEATGVTCSNCHSFNAGYQATAVTTAVHTKNNCATCHSSTTPAGVKLFVAGKAGLANQAYNCNDCHATLSGQHNKLHTAKSYLTGSTATDCASCHNTLEVSQLHTGTTGSGKALTCDSCHGTTAPPWAKTVIDANLSTNAARAGFSCDSCHTSVSNGGHKHPVSSFATSPQVDCAQCHTTDTVAKTTDLAQLHAAKNVGCSSCHNAKFDGTIIVKDGVVNVPTCATCHDGTKAPGAEVVYPDHDSTSVTTHSSASSFGTYALAGNVNCAGCHTTKNIRPVHQTVTCNKCHTSTVAEVQKVITGNWSRQTTKVPYSCADCHNAVTTTATTKHKPVHTVSSFTLAANDVESCNTCHNTMVVTDIHVGKVNKAGATMTCDSCHNSADTKVTTLISQQARSATPTYSCDSCHTLHGNGDHTATLPVGLTAEPTLKCAQCHDNDPATAGVTDLAAEHTRRINAATGQNYTCSTCHNSTRTEVRNAIATKNKSCSACHTTGWHTNLTTPHTSAYVTNPAFQCSNCHGNVLSDKTLHPDAIAGTTTIGGGPVSYKIFRGTDGVSFTEVAASSANSFSNTGLTANTKYYYQVAAVDQAGNISTKSNVAFATAAVQQTTSTVNPTSAAYSNQSNNGDSSSDGGFSTLSPSALTRLTDGRDSAGGSYDVRVQENGSSDRWIYVRISQEATNATQVVLNIRASWRDQDSKGNLLIYPYQSNGTSINTSGVVNYQINNPSYNGNFTTYSIDVTAAAHKMDGFGFIKFRIKPGSDGSRREAYISEVDYVITSGSTTGGSGTLTGDPGTATVTGTGGDSTPPSTPASLAAQGISASQINLTWTASTDPAQTVNQPGTSNCLKCHDSTQTNIQTAITTKKTNCDACHTVHGDPNVLHNTAFVLNPTMPCATCHQSRVDNEHLSRKSPTTGQQYTCDTCHKSTDPLVQGAIAANNTKCDACHTTRHTNVQSVHVSNYIPNSTVDCAGCHTATKAEFTNTADKARHAIAGTTSLATDGTYVGGYNKTSTLDCRGCHNATNSTYYGRILVKPYTASTGNSGTSSDLCFLCHDFRAYGTGGSYTSEAYSGFSLADSRMNLHVIGDHKGGCQMCHSTKPHAQTSREHFVVLKGEPNAGTSAALTKFIHRTNKAYTKDSCSAGCGSGDHP